MATIWRKTLGVFITPGEMFKVREWDETDRKLLDMLQNDFPLTVQPYLEMAERLDLTEAEVLARLTVMKQAGLIRRLGGIIDSRKIGFYSTLCAAQVPEEKIEVVASAINQLPGVTHNYLRDHEYNMWFTLTTPTRDESRQILGELENHLGLEIISMPAQKVYKIKVAFDMGNYDV